MTREHGSAARKPLRFFSADHLKRWLRGHPEGRTVMHELTVEACADCRHKDRGVLVVLYPPNYWAPDTWPSVEVFGDKIGANFGVMLKVETPEGRRLAARYMEETLPPAMAELYHPQYARGAELAEHLTAAQEFSRRVEVRTNLAVLKAIREMGKEPQCQTNAAP